MTTTRQEVWVKIDRDHSDALRADSIAATPCDDCGLVHIDMVSMVDGEHKIIATADLDFAGWLELADHVASQMEKILGIPRGGKKRDQRPRDR